MIKKHIAAIIIAIVSILIIIAAVFLISSEGGSQTVSCELYFMNEEGTSIVAETKEIKYKEEQELPRIIIERLMKGPENNRYTRVINKGTKLIGITDDGRDNLVINFTSEYLTGDATRDVQTTYAVVKTLCTLDNVKSVKVIVEGNDIMTAEGETIGYLTAEDINLSTDTYTTETREITLYFADKEEKKLTPQKRLIRMADQQPLEQYIITELIRGPLDSSADVVLDKQTTLISVDTEDSICFVNFSSDFIKKNSGEESKENLAVYSVVNSLTELDHIERVQFLINGKKTESFGDMDIMREYERDESYF